MNVLVVGSWHLGSVVGACLADAGNMVYLWDQSKKIAESWKKGLPPIHEPGLEDLVKKYWGQKLFWTEDLSLRSRNAQWIFLTYDTPVNEQDEIVFDIVEEGFNKVLQSGFSDDCHFFFTAQLPVGTSRRFLNKIAEVRPDWKGNVYYMPENLRLGEALKSFKTPDRMVVGSHHQDAVNRETAVEKFRELIGDLKTPVNIMSLESAEMVKHALNAFLATCVVFANEVSEICENQQADAWDVMASLKQDSRVGPKAFLRPGLGFSGGTLARDVKTLGKLSREKNENVFTELYKVNNKRNDWIVSHLESEINNLKGKTIALLGVTYKPGTSTVRRSPALEIATLLKSKGATCTAVDPMADIGELTENEVKTLPFKLSKDLDLVFKNADAAVVVTEWPQFKEFDFGKIKTLMKSPLLIDTKNLFSNHSVHHKFKVIVPGKPI